MSPKGWTSFVIGCVILGLISGYIAALFFKPSLIPPALRVSGVRQPTTILFLGVDVVYDKKRRGDKKSFKGRSDTIMVARLDPYKNSLSVLSIPRDTKVPVPGHGKQKVNAANALGGVELVDETLEELLDIKIDHYVVLNLKGLEELVDEIGGVDIDVPKRMRYRDRAAKLDINLKPGMKTLSGEQAIGFIRFRHDQLGDIGRVQRQEIFLKAVLTKAMNPETWTAIPRLVECANKHMLSDLNIGDLITYATFVKDVPKENQVLMMLPGRFSDSGDWLVNYREKRPIVSRFLGYTFISTDRKKLALSIINKSSDKKLSKKIYKELKSKGYKRIRIKRRKRRSAKPMETSRIIAQRGNIADAELVREDLGDIGDLVNASVGDIDSAVTLELGDDLIESE